MDEHTREAVHRKIARFALFVLMLYLFLGAIDLFGLAMKMAGSETADKLFNGLENPFAGLAVGILATALVQSSSVTTSIVVGMVGLGNMELSHAIPIVMGANIGTSITCALVSLGHVTQNEAFRRAFAGATVHDIFNLLTVLILFPLELATGYLAHSAQWCVDSLHKLGAWLSLSGPGGGFHSPIKSAVKKLAHAIAWCVEEGLSLQSKWLAAVLVLLAVVMIVGSLIVITKNMRLLMADRIEQWLNRVLGRNGTLGLLIGAVVTAIVQSSSITTSLLIPMFGAGVLKLEAGFPIMLGANIGTTITAMLAASVAGPAGFTIAMVHLLFNLSGTLIFFPLRFMRRIPIGLAEALADLAVRNRVWVAIYLVGVFLVIPGLGILIWK